MERRDRRRAGATVFSKRIHPSTLRYLAGLWGNIIKVEDETSTKARFDVARVLIDNESPNDDPDEDSRSLCNETQDAFNVEPPRNIVGEQLSHDELLDPRGEE
ncbi:hypothetical protein V6N13_134742 [Hibiscus sabdariffa]